MYRPKWRLIDPVAYLQEGQGDMSPIFQAEEGAVMQKSHPQLFDTPCCNSRFYQPKSRFTGLCV